jgi:hypothetical protein
MPDWIEVVALNGPIARLGVSALDEGEAAVIIATALAKAEAEMAGLRQAQAEVQSRLVELRKSLPRPGGPASGHQAIAVASAAPTTALEKVRLFQSVFRGRADVFPRRWENRKSGKAGYSPACSNDWAPGVCGKPQGEVLGVPEPGVHPTRRADPSRPPAGETHRGCLPSPARRHVLVPGRRLRRSLVEGGRVSVCHDMPELRIPGRDRAVTLRQRRACLALLRERRLRPGRPTPARRRRI